MSEVIEILSDESSVDTSIDSGKEEKISFVSTQEPHCLQRHCLSFCTKKMYNPSASKKNDFQTNVKKILNIKKEELPYFDRIVIVFNFQNAMSTVSLCCL